jgi:hypothetical protein
MFCPACGTQNPENAGLCSACAKPLPFAPSPTPPPPAAAPSGSIAVAPAPAPVYPPLTSIAGYSPAPSLPQPPKTMSVLGMIGIAAVILLAVAYASLAPLPELPNETQAVGYRIGTLIGALAIPFIIAFAVAGRRKARNPNLFAGLFCGIAFGMVLLNGMANLGSWQAETTDKKVGRLMREAAGLQPVRHSLFGEAKTDVKMRDLFKDLISLNKEYKDAAGKLDTSATKNLSTPESFADPDSAAGGLNQLHAAYALDAHQEERMQQIMENFKRSFDDLSASDRQAMQAGFEKGISQTMPMRQRAISAEKAWIDSMDDVYAYAQAHHADFAMSNGHLGISDPQVREDFNTRIRTTNARRTEFLQAKHALDETQSRSLQKFGVSPQQAGTQ